MIFKAHFRLVCNTATLQKKSENVLFSTLFMPKLLFVVLLKIKKKTYIVLKIELIFQK